MKQKYAPDGFEMPKNELEREEGKEAPKDAKPKYDAKADFFDSLTNSTLEERKPQRGGRDGYRGGDRGYSGGFNNRGGRGGRGGYHNWHQQDGEEGNGGYRGRGGRGRNPNYQGNRDYFERDIARKPKYSDTLKDPNANLHDNAEKDGAEGAPA